MEQSVEGSGIRDAVLRACRSLMRPLARFLVRNGVGFREFAEIAKTAFVDVVSDDYGIRGRKTNVSRVAVLTGLTRKEISRIRRSLQSESTKSERTIGRPERVLEAWYHSPAYRGPDNEPKVIPYDGEEPSFRDLVSSTGGDIPPKAMLKELLSAGSVVTTPAGELRVVSRNFIPDLRDPESVSLAGQALSDLMTTINHNLFLGDPGSSRIERRVYSDRLDHDMVDKFARLASSDGEALLSKLDDWLATQEQARPLSSDEANYRAGLGVYFFQEELRERKKRD